MQIVFFGDNLHEISNYMSAKHKKNIINLLSAKFAHNMLSVNWHQA